MRQKYYFLRICASFIHGLFIFAAYLCKEGSRTVQLDGELSKLRALLFFCPYGSFYGDAPSFYWDAPGWNGKRPKKM